MLVSLVVWLVIAPLLAVAVHECAHALVVVRQTGRRTGVVLGRGPRLARFSVGLIDVDLHLIALRDGCTVDLGGVPVSVARQALWAGPIADLVQAGLFLLVLALAPGAASMTLVGLAGAYASWGLLSLRSRSAMRWGRPYESDGFKLRELASRATHGVVVSEPQIDPLIAYLKEQAPELIAAAGPALTPLVATPPAPTTPAPQPTAAAPPLTPPQPPAAKRVDPRTATSIAPPGMR